ncbi:MAG TPA: hypothetical protein VD993_15610 [Chitinophagaceae bacterium]|nr:hypothetical protein [Chitinophagaceae bacterium]
MATIRDPKGQRQDDDNYNRDRHKDHDDYDRPRDNPRESPCDDEDDNCKDGKRPTDKTVQRERKKVCDELKDRASEVLQWEQTRHGAHQLYNDKKCCFVKTETNYQYYRNMELMVGIELLQVNEGIKDNVTAYKKWNDDLAATLKELVKTIKEAKDKVKDLKEAACKLNTCINDSCQATQRKILTGESYDNCKDNDNEVKDNCNATEVLKDLEEIPMIFLHDMNIIFNSATRVAGIQMFSNVHTLDPLQKTLQEKSKAFDDFIQEKMKKGAEDLKKGQEDLSKAVQELTKSTTGLYGKRSGYKGLKRTVEEICECRCKCINTDGDENRLEDCKCRICDICDEVKTGVCKPDDNPVCRPKQHPQQDQTQSYTY